jgi:hypothetical protein
MKMIFSRYALVLLGSGLLLISCSPKQQSPTTGMRYNDKYNGGFQVFRKTHPAPGPGLVAIEGGTFVLGGSAGEDVTYEYNNVRKRKSISTFYMDELRFLTNDWREYLYWLQTNFPEDRELYYNAIPDTLVWRRPLSYNEPYVDNYLRGSSFQDYPVVGVTWDQVQEYCDWRTQRMNENILRNQGQLADWKTRSRNLTTASGGAAGANGGATAACRYRRFRRHSTHLNNHLIPISILMANIVAMALTAKKCQKTLIRLILQLQAKQGGLYVKKTVYCAPAIACQPKQSGNTRLWALLAIPNMKTLPMVKYIHGMAWAYVRLKPNTRPDIS